MWEIAEGAERVVGALPVGTESFGVDSSEFASIVVSGVVEMSPRVLKTVLRNDSDVANSDSDATGCATVVTGC